MLCDGIELLNSTFALNLTAVVINILIIKTFHAYEIIWELLSGSEIVTFILLQNGAWLLMQFIFEILISHVGSSVRENASETIVIISKVLNEYELSDDVAFKLQNLASMLNYRNFSVQNVFFIIDWKLLVAVSER